MSYLKDLKDSKTFILYAVIAAVIGVILTFFVGGCGKNSDKAKVLVSKRVRVEVRDMPGEGPPASHHEEERVVEETIKPGVRNRPSTHKKTARAEKPSAAKKAPVKKPVKKAVTTPRPVRKATAASKKGTVKATPELMPWAVNVVSFLTPGDAEGLRKKLSSSGYNAYITKFKKGRLLFYRVRVGFFESRDKARKAGLSIVKKYRYVGKPWVVKPDRREVAEHIS